MLLIKTLHQLKVYDHIRVDINMPPATNAAFRNWINHKNTIKISSDAAMVCITYEGITKSVSLTDFDKKSV